MFGPQNPGRVLERSGGSTWRHHKAHADVKQSHEDPMAIWSTDLELNHNVLRLSGSSLITYVKLCICNSPINKGRLIPLASSP